MRAPGFVGRTSERALLDGLLERVREGESEVLVIRGEAGMGKTALLRYAARQASGFRIAELTGVEAEMELPFAGVHHLCGLMLDRLERLPAPQRDALSVALGLAAGQVPDRFLVGLAVLSLLATVAEERPLLCLVEDAQWLDAASSQILGLVARRVRAESVAILVAVREPAAAHDFDDLAELRLEGLADQDARALVRGVVTGRLDSHVVERVVAETGGNPLALLELPVRMTAAELAAGFQFPVAGELPAHIEHHYLRRIRELPEATQRLVLLAAAEPIGDAALVLRAGRRLGIDTGALAPAEAAELLQIGTSVRFRHPLVRSAVYRAASPGGRQRAHEALAEVSDPDSDADRRAWHRALAAEGPDEDVAAELERSAARAQARGGAAATAAFLDRAVALTPDPMRRRERALAAAQASVLAGAFTTARRLLAIADAGPLEESQRAQIDLLRAQLAFVSSRGSEATPLLLTAARRLESLDISIARQRTWTRSPRRCSGPDSTAVSGCPRSRRLPAPHQRSPGCRAGDRRPPTGCVRGPRHDYKTAVPRCREAVRRLSPERRSPPRNDCAGCGRVASSPWRSGRTNTRACCRTRAWRWLPGDRDAQRARARPERAYAGSRSLRGSHRRRRNGLGNSGPGGDRHPVSTVRRIDPLGVARQAGQETADLIEATEREARAAARGEGIGLAICAYARAVLCNGLGQYKAALTAAVAASEREIIAENWGLSELIEPATRTGRTDLAATPQERLARKAHAAGTDWALGIDARSRALLSEQACRAPLPRSYRSSECNRDTSRTRPHSTALR